MKKILLATALLASIPMLPNMLYAQERSAPLASAAAAATTDGSSTITTGGTFQQVLAANPVRKSLDITNVCGPNNTGGISSNGCVATTDNCYWTTVPFASATKANSHLIPPGGNYLRSTGVVPSDAIAMMCDGTGDHFQLSSQ